MKSKISDIVSKAVNDQIKLSEFWKFIIDIKEKNRQNYMTLTSVILFETNFISNAEPYEIIMNNCECDFDEVKKLNLTCYDFAWAFGLTSFSTYTTKENCWESINNLIDSRIDIYENDENTKTLFSHPNFDQDISIKLYEQWNDESVLAEELKTIFIF